MHYMHDLKDLLCAELEDFAEKGKKSGKMSMGDLETVHKLTDTVKNIMKIDVLKEEAGYSEDGHYMGEGRIYGTSYESGYSERGGSSYARGRGRYARRDSMGRYSRDGGMMYRDGRGMRGGYSRDDGKHYMMEQLEEMMEEAEKPAEKEALRRCMDALKRA